MSRTAKAAKGFATGIFQVIAQIAVQALLAPIVLKMAGRETLGAFSAIMQVLGFISLTDFLGSWVLERYLGQASGRDDGGARFRCVFTTVRTVMLLCDAVKAILIFIFSLLVSHLFHLSLHIGHDAEYALWIIAIVVVLRSPLAAYQNASYAAQDMAAVNLIGTCTGIARTVASLVFVLLGYGLFGLVVAGTLVEGAGYLFYRARFRRKNPDLMPGWGFPDKALLKEMMKFGAHASVLNLGSALLFNTGNMIAGMTEGAAMASTFYTSQMPGMTLYNMMMRFSASAMPAINELWGRGDVEKIRNALRRITRLLLALTMPLATGVLLFNRDLVITWVGLRQYAGPLLTSSLVAFCIVASLQRVAVIYAFTLGWMRVLTTTTLLQGFANLGLAFALARLFGLGGIMLALVLAILPQTVILWHRMSRFLEVNVVRLLGGCVLRTLIPLTAAAACSLLVHRVVVIRQHHFFGLFAETVTFIVAYAALAYPLVLFDHDRQEIRHYRDNILSRLRLVRAA